MPRSLGRVMKQSRKCQPVAVPGNITPLQSPEHWNSMLDRENLLSFSKPLKSSRYLKRVKVNCCVPSASNNCWFIVISPAATSTLCT